MEKVPVPLLPRVIRLAGVVAVVAVIFYFSLLDSVSAPASSPSPWWDKQLHLLAYAGLSVAAVYATAKWRRQSVRRGLVVLLAVFAYGLGIELAQGQLANRYFGFGDLLANAVGALLGGIWLVAERHIRYRRLPAKRPNP